MLIMLLDDDWWMASASALAARQISVRLCQGLLRRRRGQNKEIQIETEIFEPNKINQNKNLNLSLCHNW